MRADSVRIQRRDRELIKDVYLHRFVRRDDLLKLGYFDSVARCNDRLARLTRAGWLRRVLSINGLPTRQMVYGPGPASARFLCQRLDLPVEEVARHCREAEGPLLIEHSLRILDFRHVLCDAAIAEGIEFEEWLSESECLHEFQIAGRSRVALVIKPDAYFRLNINGIRHDFFLEIDLGHVALPRFRQKLERYGIYLKSGAFSQVYDSESFSVLTVTIGERRLSHLAALGDRGQLHFITTWNRISSEDLLRCAWARGPRSVQLGDVFAAHGKEVA